MTDKLLAQIAKMQEMAQEFVRPGAYEPRHVKRHGMTSAGYFAFDMVHMLDCPEMQEALAEAKGDVSSEQVNDFVDRVKEDNKGREQAQDAPNSTTGGQGFDAYGSETPAKPSRRKK